MNVNLKEYRFKVIMDDGKIQRYITRTHTREFAYVNVIEKVCDEYDTMVNGVKSIEMENVTIVGVFQ